MQTFCNEDRQPPSNIQRRNFLTCLVKWPTSKRSLVGMVHYIQMPSKLNTPYCVFRNTADTLKAALLIKAAVQSLLQCIFKHILQQKHLAVTSEQHWWHQAALATESPADALVFQREKADEKATGT